MRPLKLLRSGDTIAIISPANWLDEARLHNVQDKLQQRGYRVKISAQSYARYGQFAGSDTERAAALIGAFADPEIDAILCARGGYGSPRILDQINYDVIAANPKVFIGYSDITTLLNYIPQRCDFPTFHGPMAVDLADDDQRADIDELLAMVSGNAIVTEIDQATPLQVGKICAPLYGGNLALLEMMAGTPYFPKLENAILLIEDVNEYLYKIDRSLTHLRLAGALDGIQGAIIGTMAELGDGTMPFGFSELDLYRSFFCTDRTKYPVAAHMPFGHMVMRKTIPIGWPIEFSVAEPVKITITPGLFTADDAR